MDGKEYAFTYAELLTLKWHYGEYQFPFKPGYDRDPHTGSEDYFGTSKDAMTIVAVNANYAGTTHVNIMKDGGTRTVFNGHVRSLDELRLILELIQ